LLQDNNSSPPKIKSKKDEEKIKERINALELEVFGLNEEPIEDELDMDIQKIKFRPSGSDIVEPGPNLG
jgi:hypothetical protein